MRNLLNPLIFALQENNSLPLPKVEGDERAQARALAILYSHPVVSTQLQLFTTSIKCYITWITT